MHALTSPLLSNQQECLANSKKFPISIITRCVKFYLKTEGYHHKKDLSCLVRNSMVLVCPFLSFRDSISSSSSLIGLLALSMSVLLLFACFLFSCTMATVPSTIDCMTSSLHVLREPADTLAVALAHDDGAHEDLHRADALESNLALAGCNTLQISTKLLLDNAIIQQENSLVW